VREAPGAGFLVLFCKKELPSCFDFVGLGWVGFVIMPTAAADVMGGASVTHPTIFVCRRLRQMR
jgi:hypothetical protein